MVLTGRQTTLQSDHEDARKSLRDGASNGKQNSFTIISSSLFVNAGRALQARIRRPATKVRIREKPGDGMSIPPKSIWKTRLVKGEFQDSFFDIEFWQEQGDEAIFCCGMGIGELSEEIQGRKPMLDKSVTALKRI